MHKCFFHSVWQFQYFDREDLTSEKEAINIIESGQYNTDPGPDFSDDRALDFMQNLPVERSRINRLWRDFEFNTKNGFDFQALGEINNNFCSLRKCLKYNIGTSLLKQSCN